MHVLAGEGKVCLDVTNRDNTPLDEAREAQSWTPPRHLPCNLNPADALAIRVCLHHEVCLLLKLTLNHGPHTSWVSTCLRRQL